jgi:hypothetical protein
MTHWSDVAITVRLVRAEDRLRLREAIIELQDYERAIHGTRRPGKQIAEAYLTGLKISRLAPNFSTQK